MNVIYGESALNRDLSADASSSPLHPVVVNKFIENAQKVDVSIAKNAGVHSRDATVVPPAISLSGGDTEHLGTIAEKVVAAFKVSGPHNTQVIRSVVLKTCLNSSLLRPPISPSPNSYFPQRLARVSLQPSFVSFRRPSVFLSRTFHQSGPRMDHDRKPEEKTKPSLSEKSQGVGAEKIWTIPNILTASRVLSCPVLGYAILHDNFYVATGLLVYAGLTDFVRV